MSFAEHAGKGKQFGFDQKLDDLLLVDVKVDRTTKYQHEIKASQEEVKEREENAILSLKSNYQR